MSSEYEYDDEDEEGLEPLEPGERGTVLDDLPEDGGLREGGIADRLPEYNMRSRKYGLYQQGVSAFVFGHKGSGKSEWIKEACKALKPFVDRAVCYSGSDLRSKQFSGDGTFHPAFVVHDPRSGDFTAMLDERRGEMRKWREIDERGEYYRQRRLLVVADDVAQMTEVIKRSNKTMIQLMTTTRWLALFIFVAIQSAGLVGMQNRINADLVVIGREVSGEGLGALYDAFVKRNLKISPAWFRRMVDEVCIRGERVLIYDQREGALFKHTIVRTPPLERPLGSPAWLAYGDRIWRNSRGYGGTRAFMREMVRRRAQRNRAEIEKEQKALGMAKRGQNRRGR